MRTRTHKKLYNERVIETEASVILLKSNKYKGVKGCYKTITSGYKKEQYGNIRYENSKFDIENTIRGINS